MYTLRNFHVHRLVQSIHARHELLFRRHGSYRRLCNAYLGTQPRTVRHSIRKASSNAVEVVRLTENQSETVVHETPCNVFDSLHVSQGPALRHDKESESTAQGRSYEHLLTRKESLDVSRTAKECFDEFWRSPGTARITDLSYWDVLKGELEDKFPKASISQRHAFRTESNGNPDRTLTLLFMLEYYGQITILQGLPDNATNALLSSLIREDLPEAYEKIGCLFDYSWILLAEPIHLVPRYIALSQHREKIGSKPLPLWVLLQILRTPSLDRYSVTHLIEWVSPRLESWNWSGNSAMILGVRLLRHARRVPTPDYESITACFLSAVSLRFKNETSSELSLITHWCNRFLSLLALPATHKPFQTAKVQQAAQLDMLQFMQDYQPEINVGREGYRALARVQLMHAKTDSEREWAAAKALTWPPWEERNRMGAFPAPARYEGQETRVLKVLNRMLEAGYAPHKFEASMQILTGWDTDKSPTVQLTRVPPRVSKPWLPGERLDKATLTSDPLIWSSRIHATRTVREAWMVFCSYASIVPSVEHSQFVYRSMHQKLLARQISTSSVIRLLPGDGPEVFPDPELARDKVYIPQEIPTPQDLVARMVDNNIACGSNVLAYFLARELTLETGFELILRSRLDPETRSVLSKPHIQSASATAECIGGLVPILRSAYVNMLTRPNGPKSQALQRYGSTQCESGPSFVQQCLLSSTTCDIAMWNSHLAGLVRHVDNPPAGIHRLPFGEFLRLVTVALSYICRKVRPCSQTLRTVLPVAQLYRFPVHLLKELFVISVCGKDANVPTTWEKFCDTRSHAFQSFPSGDDIESMGWALGSQPPTTSGGDVLLLLRWFHTHRKLFFEAGIKITTHNLAVFRLFLEQEWMRQALGSEAPVWDCSPTQALQLDEMLLDIACDTVYPNDEYMSRYLSLQRSNIRRVLFKVQKLRDSSELERLPSSRAASH